jgi:hypothetical protein
MNVRYRVELSQVERTELKALLSGGRHASRKRICHLLQRSLRCADITASPPTV